MIMIIVNWPCLTEPIALYNMRSIRCWTISMLLQLMCGNKEILNIFTEVFIIFAWIYNLKFTHQTMKTCDNE